MKIYKRRLRTVILATWAFFVMGCTGENPEEEGFREALVPVPFNEVKLQDDFWLPRLRTQKETLVPFALEKTAPAVENLQKAANYLMGDTTDLPFPHRYISSDLYKVMEGAALLLRENPDPALEKRMDSIIDIIADAQKDDGYLYVAHITGVSKDHAHWGGAGMGDKPYSWVLHSHELYNMGHMYEAAIAYYRSTGKDKWLKVAEKNAQHLNRVFFEGDPDYNEGRPVNQAPGHQELELALVKLYRVTSKELYLDMAKKFLDIRGKTFVPEGEGVMSPTYSQQHLPVAEQKEAVGHAVRAMYQYSGMADVAAQTGTQEYDTALRTIWNNITDTKMHITGGLGAMHGIEGFGPEYVLPNKEAYNETCAAVGNVLFNHRMFLMTRDARYMDVAEVALLNNALAGVNMEGNRFFYVNPLEADGTTPFNHGKAGRSPWFGTACCPSNIARLIPQVSGMMYAYTKNDVYATFYASSTTEIPLQQGRVQIDQQSDYPFDGTITFQLHAEKRQEFALRLRIPTWAQGQFVPGELYDYVDGKVPQREVTVNGKKVQPEMKNGFAVLDRVWNPGDKVRLTLPMPVRLNTALDAVTANKGRIAITRGPLVYCAEGLDNEVQAQQLVLDTIQQNTQLGTIREGVLRNVETITLGGRARGADGTSDKEIRLIPYYAWNNRGESSMMVWFPTDPKAVQYQEGNVLRGGKYRGVEASSTAERGSLEAILDGRRPMNSNDRSIPAWVSKETDAAPWIVIGLDASRPIRSVNVYWKHDDKSVKVPGQWSLEYQENTQWKPFERYVTDTYGTEKDQYNVVHPAKELHCEAVRINLKPQKGVAVGILDVDIPYETMTE